MSLTDILIRTLTPQDIDAVMALEQSIPDSVMWAPATKEEQMKIILGSNAYGIFEHETLFGKVGFIETARDEWEIDGMIIDTAHRGKSYGTMLFTKALEACIESKHPKHMHLTTHPANNAALRLYLSFGFTITQWIPNKYGPGQDRLYLIKNLS